MAAFSKDLVYIKTVVLDHSIPLSLKKTISLSLSLSFYLSLSSLNWIEQHCQKTEQIERERLLKWIKHLGSAKRGISVRLNFFLNTLCARLFDLLSSNIVHSCSRREIIFKMALLYLISQNRKFNTLEIQKPDLLTIRQYRPLLLFYIVRCKQLQM